MKHLIIIILLVSSCTSEKTPKNTTIDNDDLNWALDIRIKRIEFDSCEYLVSTRTDAISTIHKQNCKYCIERNKKK